MSRHPRGGAGPALCSSIIVRFDGLPRDCNPTLRSRVSGGEHSVSYGAREVVNSTCEPGASEIATRFKYRPVSVGSVNERGYRQRRAQEGTELNDNIG